MMNARSEYREAAVRGASRVGLVVMLYEQAISDLRVAGEAMQRGEIELRTRAINHAYTIIGHLQSTLDRERGGAVSRNLDLFYHRIRSRLTEAQFRMSPAILQEQMSSLLSLRDAWAEVDRATRAIPSPGAADSPLRKRPAAAEDAASTDWIG